VCLIAVLWLAAIAGAAPLNLQQSLGVAPVRPAPGLAATPATPASLAHALQQTTGLQPSQVTSQDACSSPQPGGLRCDALTLVLRSDRDRIHPHIRAGATFTQVFPRHRRGIATPSATPAAGTTSGAAAPPGAGTPAYLQQAYDLTYLSQTAGGSDTVAIVDAYDDPSAASDLATFRSTYGLPPCTTANGCFRKLNEYGQASPLPAADSGWQVEESLDMDAVSSLCPNCHILLLEATPSVSDLDTAIATAQSLGANQVSNSWSASSSQPFGTSSFPGISVLASTGDAGYAGPGWDNYPAAFPGVTAVGGTTLSAAGTASSARGFTETAWSNSGGEGGGSGCDLNEPKPSYQSDTGCTGRSYADVSADANPETGLGIYDSGDGGWLLVGGTSLSSPLTAAFEAVTGVNGTTAGWAYKDSALLNDPVSGTSGSCSIYYICNAGPGYDGPTGIGSISGDIATGAPGIGGPAVGNGSNNTYAQTVGGNQVALTGGVYPNGLDTTYSWQYGATTSYGQQTAATDIGSGSLPVSTPATITALAPSTTYHYRLVAANSDGTAYGYDYTFTTAGPGAVAPVNSVAPSIAGTPQQGAALTVNAGTWGPTPTSYAYQWQNSTDGGTTWTTISGAAGSTHTPGTGDLNAEIRVIVIASDAYGSNAADSAAVGPVVSGAPVNTGPPSISGTPQQGQTLSAANGGWSPAAASYTYQWQRSADAGNTWTSVGGATASTYTPGTADLNGELRVIVTGVNPYGSAASTSAGVGPVTSGAPVNRSAPAVSGNPEQGQVLSVVSTWNPAGTYAYQWQRSADGGNTWASIAGATGAGYTPAAADVGSQLRVQVTATNPYGQLSLASPAVGPVVSDAPVSTSLPVVTGTEQRTDTLAATTGSWTGPGLSYAYQWQRSPDGTNWTSIAGATSASYTLQAADEGDDMRALITAVNVNGTASEPSAATQVVAPYPPADTVAPTLSGIAERGYVLTATQGTWTGPDNTYAYQWQEDYGEGFVDVAGATSSTYTLGVQDEGAAVRVLVTATDPDASVVTASQPTATVTDQLPVNTTAPSLGGTVARGSTLTASAGAWTGSGNSYAYQWQSSPDGTIWTNIAAATGTTYALGVGDEGSQLRVVVTATNPDGTVSAASAPTVTVPSAPPVATTLPSVSGTAQRGSTLSSAQGTWTGIGNSYTQQWQRSLDGSTWTSVAGATSATYALGVGDEGYRFRLLVTATNPDATVSVASAGTSAVVGSPPVGQSLPIVTGTLQRTGVLSAANGSWGGLGDGYAVQWQRSPDGSTWNAVQGATGWTYTVGTADEGDQLRAVVTATNVDGSASQASVPTATVPSSPPVLAVAPTVSGTPVRTATLTATLGAWSGIGNAYAYQWQRAAGATWTSISGATGSTYVIGAGDEGSQLRVVVTATNPDGSATAASAATGTVASAPPVQTAAPTLSGNVSRTSTLTATVGTWNGIGNSYADQWQRSVGGGPWTNISGATGLTYTVGVADEGASLRFAVTVSNPDGSVTGASAATVVVPSAPPVVNVVPTLSGGNQRGSTVSATQGTWSGIGNGYGYQWQRTSNGSTWSNISGATGATYALAVADEGYAVRVQVTASNPDGTVTASSAPTATVVAVPPVQTAAPAVSGTLVRTSTLTGTTGSWSGAGNGFALQWQRSADGVTWSDISGATSATYTLGVADEADVVRLVVTASNPDGTSVATSAPTAPVAAAPPVDTALPTVTGTVARSSTLTGTAGTWNGIGNGYAFQWQHSVAGGPWTNIYGATSATYALGVADEGSQLRLEVIATNPDATVTAVSASTVTVPPAPPVLTAAPSISGIPERGLTMQASLGSWSGIGNTTAVQWQSSPDGNLWTNIPGATNSSYTLAVTDEGYQVRALVTVTNPDGTASAASGTSARIAAAPPAALTEPTLSGQAQRADTLTATAGTWAGNGNSYTDQWQRSTGGTAWTNITGATGTTYTLGTSDEGDRVRMLVTAVNADATVSVATPASAAVAGAPPVDTALPTVSGNAERTGTVTAVAGSWGGVGNAYSYQWQRSPSGSGWSDIGGATSLTYNPATADEGDQLRIVVSATNPDGTVSAASAATPAVQGAPPANTTAPSVSGTPTLGSTLTAAPGSWSPGDVAYAYQWQHGTGAGGYQNIAGATSATYVVGQGDLGDAIRVTVIGTNVDGSVTASSTATATVVPPPANRTAPAVPSGTDMNGNTLTADNGSWSTPATLSYAWLRCPASATGETSACTGIASGSTYAVAGADVGYRLMVAVTATAAGGSTTAYSGLTDVIQGQPLTNDAPPGISGNPQVPNKLTAVSGAWSVGLTADSFAWERCDADGVSDCTQVAANTNQYRLTGADDNHTIIAVETASSPGHTATAHSAPLAIEDQPLPEAIVAPALSGTPTRGFTLAATGGSWTNGPVTVTYQWERCDGGGHNCQPIPGATQTTYTVARADEGSTLTVAVTASNSTGASTVSPAVTAVLSGLPPVLTQAPSLSNPAVQQSVPVSITGIAWQATSDTTYATSWERCDAAGHNCQTIPGAVQNSYMPAAADVGHTLIGVITATNPDAAVPGATQPSALVLPAAPRWKDLPVLNVANGDVGTTISITPGVWTGPVVSLDAIQVMRCTNVCVPVETGSQYTIAAADTGAILRVRETASNAGGATVVWSAQYVGPVASDASASGVLNDGQVALRNDKGTVLAVAAAATNVNETTNALFGAHADHRGAVARAITVRRAAGIRGGLRAWVCPATTPRGGAPLPCTRQVSLTGSATLKLPPSMTGRVRVVVVRRRG
jgi:hypothetical protein